MIRRVVKKVVKEVEVVISSDLICDKCGKTIIPEAYVIDECKLHIVSGVAYPEGGSSCTKTMDLCDSCAEELVELLKDNGYRLNEEEKDY